MKIDVPFPQIGVAFIQDFFNGAEYAHKNRGDCDPEKNLDIDPMVCKPDKNKNNKRDHDHQ